LLFGNGKTARPAGRSVTPRYKVAVEIDGGIYNRGRHVRGSGFERDAEKRNAAVMAGWRALHFTPRHVKSGLAVQAIESLMRKIS